MQKGNLIQNGELILAPGTHTTPNWNTDYSDYIFETEFRFFGSTTGWSGMSVYLRYSNPPCAGITGNCSDQVGVSTQGTVSAWRPNGTDSYDNFLSDTDATSFAPNGENQLTVIVNGNEFQIFLNHVFVRSFTDSTYKSGIIVLDTDGTSVAFNYIRIYAIP